MFLCKNLSQPSLISFISRAVSQHCHINVCILMDLKTNSIAFLDTLKLLMLAPAASLVQKHLNQPIFLIHVSVV